MAIERLSNYLGGKWTPFRGEHLGVTNPATGAVIAEVPLSGGAETCEAVLAATRAFSTWRRTPAGERVQFLFKLKGLLEEHLDEIARIVTDECGKTYTESVGELRRGIENVEVACGIPLMLQGAVSEDIAPGVDELMIRQPLGVVGVITPFNFPGMIPLWFLPYAIACGNTVVLKPSEKVPITATRLVGLFEQSGLPPGVVNLVHGAGAAAEALVDHPDVRAISFVGSSGVARQVYARATAAGKRAQCQAGAKNPVVVLPDADLDSTVPIIADSAFGCAGQRCLAASVAVTVGAARRPFTEAIAEVAQTRTVGYGSDPGVQMGPVISAESRARIAGLIDVGLGEGARPVVDGRAAAPKGYENGYFLRPTVLEDVPAAGTLAGTEIFGPVLSLLHVETIEDAIDVVNRSAFGNMACLFTSSGAAARKFRYDVQAGNIGINIGVAAPIAFFPFSGWKESFFGDLHGQGRDAVEFYTDKKVIVERWRTEWSRKF
jgi:malonate-semialdehyde dehydrogenase (acetylating) / methylmalonate-semialdehyde dehydrogenase